MRNLLKNHLKNHFHDGGPYLQNKSMDWFLYDRDLRHERVKYIAYFQENLNF